MSPRGRSLTTCLKTFFIIFNAAPMQCWSLLVLESRLVCEDGVVGNKDQGPWTRDKDQRPRTKDQGPRIRDKDQDPRTTDRVRGLGTLQMRAGSREGSLLSGVWKGARWFRGMGTGVWVGAKVCKAMDLSFPRPFFTQGPRICWRWRSHPF